MSVIAFCQPLNKASATMACPILSSESSAIAATGMTEALIVKELPFPMPDVHIDMLWHERDARNPGHRWLRDLLGHSGALGVLPPTEKA